MAGIFTQRRDLKSPIAKSDGRYKVEYAGQYWPGIQTATWSIPKLRELTTSYRSGGAVELQEVDPKFLINETSRQVMKPYDTGHEFMNKKTKLYSSHHDFTARGRNKSYWRGPILANVSNVIPNLDFPYTPSGIDLSKGTFAIRQTIPNKSAASIAQTLSELLVDLPRIPFSAFNKRPGSKFELHKQAGEEYLNQVFAWSPLIRDLYKIISAVYKTQQILEQWERDAGRQVRRRFSFDETLISSSTTRYVNQPLQNVENWSTSLGKDLFPNQASSVGTLDITTTITERYWFSGAYLYGLPDGSSAWDKLMRYGAFAEKLLGTRADLELLWELAPWSWLSDWFVNIGDLIAVNNALANDNLVIRYGYLMRSTHWQRTAIHSGVVFWSGPTGPISTNLVFTQKERVRATPYGFGINTGAFTSQQWAILGALGMTLGDHKLHWG